VLISVERRDETLDDADAVLDVQVGVHLRDLRPENVLERALRQRDHRHVVFELAQRGGNLAADPSPTDHDDRLRRAGGLAQRIRILDVAQVANATETGSHEAQLPRGRTGCKQQRVVGQVGPIVQVQRAGDRVERDRPATAQQLDVLSPVVGLRADQCLLERVLAAQVSLRQRRALVGGNLLFADEHHATLHSVLAQGECRVGAAQPSADNDNRIVLVHESLRSVSR
jgi:hypothetical protein